MVHKGPLVLTAADAFVLKAVVAGERGHLPDGRAARPFLTGQKFSAL